MKRQAGMTLIELVIVIIVLGIIAAVAAPKLADISGKAKTSSVAGSLGAFKSGVTIAQAVAGANKMAWGSLSDQLDGFVMSSANGSITLDVDGDTNLDINIATFTGADCTTAVTAAGDIVASWKDGTGSCEKL